MNDIIFRLFQSTDIYALQQLMQTTINTCYASYPPEYRQHWMDDHHSSDHILQEAAEGFTLVIERHGKIIGTGNIMHDWIQSILIHPEYQRQGYATELIHRLEEQARQKGVNRVQLTALPPAKSFFEHLGYHTISEHHFKAEHLRQFTYYRMEKQI